MMKAITKETILRHDYINEQITTIYFGGGTPSLISTEDLQVLLAKLHEIFSVAADAEITLEANPDDITEQKLNEWKAGRHQPFKHRRTIFF